MAVSPKLNITNLSNLKPSISSSVTCSYTTGKWEDFQTMQNMILFMLSSVFARECLVCGAGKEEEAWVYILSNLRDWGGYKVFFSGILGRIKNFGGKQFHFWLIFTLF